MNERITPLAIHTLGEQDMTIFSRRIDLRIEAPVLRIYMTSAVFYLSYHRIYTQTFTCEAQSPSTMIKNYIYTNIEKYTKAYIKTNVNIPKHTSTQV